MLRFALKNMATRRAKLLLTALSVILSASVALLAYNVSTQVSEGIVNTAAKYDIIIGPSGSATQLAMNTMFFTDKPLGTIPYALVEALRDSGRVNAAIPFSMGDSYNAAPIVGTDAALLEGKPLQSGELFSEPLQAVVGAAVAAAYDLGPGDRIVTSHGLSASGTAHAETPLTVVGVLRRTDTAYDNAVFTPVSTIWALHDHGEDGDEHGDEAHRDGDAEADVSAEAAPSHADGYGAAPDPAPASHADADRDGDAAEPAPTGHGGDADTAHADGDGGDAPGTAAASHVEADHGRAEGGEICAVLVRSKSLSDYSALMSAYGGNSEYLAINPNTVLREVMDNVDLSRRIVYILCAVILVMNLFVVSVIAVLNMYDSRAEIALMRLIGVSMGKINRLYLIQNAIAGLCAMALSLLTAHLCLWALRGFVAGMGIVLNATRIYPLEWAILLCVFLLSILPTTLLTRRMARQDGMER